MTLTLEAAKHAIDAHNQVFRIVEYPIDLSDYSVTRNEAKEINEYDPRFKPCIVVTTAREALEAAWAVAHPIPEGTIIPAETPLIARGPEGITFIDEGYRLTIKVNGLGETEYRTLTPLPEPKPEPWEQSRYCYADGDIYKRFQDARGVYWMRPAYQLFYSREALAKLNPRPVTIEGHDE